MMTSTEKFSPEQIKEMWVRSKLDGLLKPFSNRSLTKTYYQLLLNDLTRFCMGEIRIAKTKIK